jgi:hypothetical protein
LRTGLAPRRERVTTATRGEGLDGQVLSPSTPDESSAGTGQAP